MDETNSTNAVGEDAYSAEPQTAQRILEEALREFAARGLAGARVDRIAAAAGVNKAMIYYHFSSKDNLYLQAVESVMTDVVHGLSEALDRKEDLESTLRQMAQRYQEIYFRHPYFRSIFLREMATPDSPIMDLIASTVTSAAVPARLMEKLRQGREAGELIFEDERQVSSAFVTLNIGFYTASPVFQRVFHLNDPADFETFLEARIEAIVNVFLNGIRVRT